MVSSTLDKQFEEKLNRILHQPSLLTLDQLRFIAKKVLPHILEINPEYLEKLENRLKNDAMKRIELLKLIDPIPIIDPSKKVKNAEKEYDIVKKINIYLRAILDVEFMIGHAKLFRKWENKKDYSHDQYINDVVNLNNRIYSILK